MQLLIFVICAGPATGGGTRREESIELRVKLVNWEVGAADRAVWTMQRPRLVRAIVLEPGVSCVGSTTCSFARSVMVRLSVVALIECPG